MTHKHRSGNFSFGSHHSTINFDLQEMKNQHILSLISYLSQNIKNLDTIHKISQILQQNLDFSYFKLLKSKLTQIDYLTVIQKLGLVYKEAESIIIEKKKRNDYFYVVLWGQVHILDEVKTTEIPQEQQQIQFQVINTIVKGDTFGQSSLVSFKRQTTARVQAKTNCLLLTLSFDVFNRTILKVTIMRKQQVANILMKSSLFLGIDQDQIKDLVTQVYQFRFKLHEPIYIPGSKHDCFYYVKNGNVQVLQNGVKLVTMSSGQYFGIQNKKLIESSRVQYAISKSTDLALYKVTFDRLKILQQTYLNKFMKNLARDFNNKKQNYEKLLANYKKVQRIIASNNINNPLTTKNKRMKKQNIPLNPIWWGTANRYQYNNIPKCTTSSIEKQKQKQSLKSQSFGLLGQKRINHLRHSIVTKLNQSQHTESLNHSSSIVGSLPGTLYKKVVHQNIQSFDAEVLKRKLIPQYQKQKLLKYAKSSTDNCQTMFWS